MVLKLALSILLFMSIIGFSVGTFVIKEGEGHPHPSKHNRSIENLIMHPFQSLLESSQVSERISTRNTRIRC